MVFFFINNIKNSTDKYEYLKTYRVKTVLISSFLLFSTYYIANSLFESDPNFSYFFENEKELSPEEIERQNREIDKEYQLEKKRALADSLTSVNEDHLFETNVLNIDSHYVYQKEHFRLPKMILNDSNNILFERDDYTSLNRYVDLTKSYEQAYIDMGYMGVGMFLFYEGKFNAAIDSLSKVKNKKLKYLDFFFAKSFEGSNQIDKAIPFYEKALNNTPGMTDSIHIKLVDYYIQNNVSDKLYHYVKTKSLQKFLDYELIRKTMLSNFHVIDYYIFVLENDFKNIDLTNVFSALAICVIWFIFLNSIDIFEKENYRNIILCTLLGGFFSLFTFVISDSLELIFPLNPHSNALLYFIFDVGLVEELVKIIPLLILLKYTKSIDEPFDYLLYASLAALGFATIENMLYFSRGSMTIIFTRALLCATGHMTFSSIIAYGIVKAKLFNPKKVLINFLSYWLLAATVHGLYDYFLSKEFVIGGEMVFISSVTLWFIFINNTLNFSPKFTYQTKVHIDNKIVFLGVGLTSILIMEFIINLVRYDINLANRSLFQNLVFASGIIIFMIYKVSNLDLVKKYWRPIKLDSGKNFANPLNLFVLIMRFFLGNHIAAQNFVDKHIMITPFWTNKGLLELMPEPVEGVIRDRIIMLTKNEDGKVESDATWFIVKMNKDLQLQDYNTNYLLIKFRNEIESLKVDNDNTAKLSLINDFALFEDNKTTWNNTTPFGYITVWETENTEAILGRRNV